MTYLSVEQLSKTYGLKKLFEGLDFGISKGDKTALVAPNGTGKSTLLRVMAGRESPDKGKVMVRNGIRVGFLEQEPRLDDRKTISEYITQGHSDTVRIIRNYEKAAQAQADNYNDITQKAFEKALAAMDASRAWDYEQRMEQILGKLDIHDLNQSVASLSGGERKRVALAFVLLEDPELLLLDEPTNHLDVDMIEWLEQYLAKTTTTLFMVTHDRYFLDRVCNHILEIDDGILYHHKGNYGRYLQKKYERQEIEAINTGKAGQLLKKELEWMRRSPKARTTKSKSRIAAFYETKEKARQKKPEAELHLQINMQRMGSKILELENVNKRFGSTVILDKFSYLFKKGERIGIIGQNGTGKTTFLKILTGEEPADSGHIEKGSTITFGHYRQQGIRSDESLRVIEVLKNVAEVIETADGTSMSASRFLEHFMFTTEMQYTPVSRLSGGERRRLGLMMVLMKNPNFLILDEPTNDLDLMTLNRLEDFLQNFGGCLIVVSHDRFFMDKLVQHYFIFEGNGVISDHNGTWQEYRDEHPAGGNGKQSAGQNGNKQKRSGSSGRQSRSGEHATGSGPAQETSRRHANTTGSRSRPGKKGLSYKERKEQQKLEKEIGQLEEEKAVMEAEIASGRLDYKDLNEKTRRFGELQELIDEKSLQWLELAEQE